MHKFNLIENAQDSLIHAIDHLGSVNTNSTGDWKRAILDLSHVVELLLKERLRRVHPAFVFKKIENYPSPKEFTVNTAIALERLKKFGGLTFSKSEENAVTGARNKRNDIEHFEFIITNEEAKIIVGQALSFILKFAEKELELDWKAHIEEDKWTILHGYTNFYESLIRDVVENGGGLATIHCPTCDNDYFDLFTDSCHLCGHREEVLECEKCSGSYLHSEIEHMRFSGICYDCNSLD